MIYNEPHDYSLFAVASELPLFADRFLEAEAKSLGIMEMVARRGRIDDYVIYTPDLDRGNCALEAITKPLTVAGQMMTYSSVAMALLGTDCGAVFYVSWWPDLIGFADIWDWSLVMSPMTVRYQITPGFEWNDVSAGDVVFFDQGWSFDAEETYTEAAVSEGWVFIIDEGRLDYTLPYSVAVGETLRLYSNRPLTPRLP